MDIDTTKPIFRFLQIFLSSYFINNLANNIDGLYKLFYNARTF